MREVILVSIKDIQSAIRRCSIDQDMFNLNVLLAHALQTIPKVIGGVIGNCND